MGIGTIRSARRILVLATGENKATAVRRLVYGPEDPEWPCSFLADHANLDLLADRGAARALAEGGGSEVM
jgi:glucosamine-6-phosphate deaminase